MSSMTDDRLTAEEMTAAMDQLHAVSMATWRELLVFIAEYDRSEAYRADAMVSMADWLVARYGLARSTANARVLASRALENLPAVADAVAAGRLSIDQTRSVIRLATAENDAAVAADAVGRSAAELETMVRLAKPPAATDASDADRNRSFRWRNSSEGQSVRLSGQLPVDAAATLAAVLTRMAEQAGPDADTGLFDPFDSRCADALVELAGAHLAEDADPDRATVVVHVPVEWFDGGSDGGLDNAIAASLESGVPLAAETLHRLACDARVQLVAEGPGHAAMARSAMEHTVPFWLRRQIRRRDGGCRWRGCRRTHGLHAHHLVWFSKGWADGHRQPGAVVPSAPSGRARRRVEHRRRPGGRPPLHASQRRPARDPTTTLAGGHARLASRSRPLVGDGAPPRLLAGLTADASAAAA